MKNQYIGDINDYHKYGLLRTILKNSSLRLFVEWMATADDGGPDGRKRRYLRESQRWRAVDPELFDALLLATENDAAPSLSTIEELAVLPNAEYHSTIVPDAKADRLGWRQGFLQRLDESSSDFVFFDPDNGVEVPSTAIGRRDSSKYVFWDEIESAWVRECSVIVYQHFPHVPRDSFTSSAIEALASHTGAPFIATFRTSDVLFLAAAQNPHVDLLRDACRSQLGAWASQFRVSAVDRQPNWQTGCTSREESDYRRG